MRIRVALLALAAVVAGCGKVTPASAPPTPSPERLDAEVLTRDAGGSGVAVALSETPIHLSAFRSWYAAAPDASPEPVEDRPGTSYLATTADTGCRTPTSVEVWRTSDELEVRFVGGTEPKTCAQRRDSFAYLAVADKDVAGARRINGLAPMDPAGPGHLLDFVPLGTIRLPNPITPVVLGTGDTAAITALHNQLAATTRLSEVDAALDRPADQRMHQYAFVLPGCEEKGALLLVGANRVWAEPTGPAHVACIAAEYYLATFEIPTDHVPDGATLGS
jgi:hypothetical protein